MSNKKTAIVTGGTKNQFFAMAVLALNIADKCPNIADELVIFHDGVSEEDQKKVQKIFPTRFIEYKSPFEKVKGFSNTVSKYFSLMVFCKYECFRLLDEYKTVIWTDYDILIRKDISYIKNKGNYSCKFIKDSFLQTKFTFGLYREDFRNEVEKLNFNEKAVSCPIFVLYDDLSNYEKIYKDCIEYTVKLACALELPEEGVISLCLQKYRVDVDCLNCAEFVTPPSKFKELEKTANIFHAVGQPKFWNGLYNKDWQNYYDVWVNEYKGTKFVKMHPKQRFKNFIKNLLPYGFVNYYINR